MDISTAFPRSLVQFFMLYILFVIGQDIWDTPSDKTSVWLPPFFPFKNDLSLRTDA